MMTSTFNAAVSQHAAWIDYWRHQATQHARDGARALYPIGVLAATQGTRIPYSDAAQYLHNSGKGYGGRRSVLPLDALAGLCAALGVPDLSSVFWSQETIDLTTFAHPDADIPRWASIEDKETEEARCRRHTSWGDPNSV